LFIIGIDSTTIKIVLPSIQRPVPGLQRTVDAYTLLVLASS